MMSADEIKREEKEHVMQTYSRYNLVVQRGEGCHLYDTSGKEYLDFLGGLATCSVGHANKEVADAITHQAKDRKSTRLNSSH